MTLLAMLSVVSNLKIVSAVDLLSRTHLLFLIIVVWIALWYSRVGNLYSLLCSCSHNGFAKIALVRLPSLLELLNIITFTFTRNKIDSISTARSRST